MGCVWGIVYTGGVWGACGVYTQVACVWTVDWPVCLCALRTPIWLRLRLRLLADHGSTLCRFPRHAARQALAGQARNMLRPIPAAVYTR